MTVTVPFTLTAQFAGSSTPAWGPTSATVTQKEFNHDVAVLETFADDVDSDSYQSGMPVQIIYGRPGSTRTFWGYVNDASRVNNRLNPGSLSGGNSTVVRCVGASWYMKQTSTYVFTNMTADQVVTQIASVFGLAALTVPHPMVWSSLPMGGQSFWQFCVGLAQRIGYTFYCNGIQLMFKPRATNPLNLVGYVRSYDYSTGASTLPVFTPTVGVASVSGGQLKNRQMAGINPRTQMPFVSTVRGNPASSVLGVNPEAPIFTETAHFTADNQEEADTKLNGLAQSNQLYMTAGATAVGDSQISQGALVYVFNANGSQNGLWYVTSGVHQFNEQTYQLNMSLGRDSKGAATVISTSPVLVTPPQAVLVRGSIWQVAA